MRNHNTLINRSFLFSALAILTIAVLSTMLTHISKAATDCSIADVSQAECEALVTLYYSTDGDNWTNLRANSTWLKDSSVCNWTGVTCSNSVITDLELRNSNLSGAIPSEIGNLVYLQRLLLAGNRLTSLPKEIGNLTNLQFIDLMGNPLVDIPSDMGNLSSLQILFLSSYTITDFPAELGNLTNLQTLWLTFSGLSEVPAWIANLTNLNDLNLQNNSLTNLPDWIGNLTNLQFLNLRNNQLTMLPDTLTNLVNLQQLSINDNALSRATMSPALQEFVDRLSSSWEESQTTISNPQSTTVPGTYTEEKPSLPGVEFGMNSLDDCYSDDLSNLPNGWYASNGALFDNEEELILNNSSIISEEDITGINYGTIRLEDGEIYLGITYVPDNPDVSLLSYVKTERYLRENQFLEADNGNMYRRYDQQWSSALTGQELQILSVTTQPLDQPLHGDWLVFSIFHPSDATLFENLVIDIAVSLSNNSCILRNIFEGSSSLSNTTNLSQEASQIGNEQDCIQFEAGSVYEIVFEGPQVNSADIQAVLDEVTSGTAIIQQLGSPEDSQWLIFTEYLEQEKSVELLERLATIAPLNDDAISIETVSPACFSVPSGIRIVLQTRLSSDQYDMDDLRETADVISRRITALGLTDATVQIQGGHRILMEIPDVGDPGQVIETIQEIALLEFVDFSGLSLQQVQNLVGQPILTDEQLRLNQQTNVTNTAIEVEVNPLTGEPFETVLTGARLEEAQAILDPNIGIWMIQFSLDADGSDIFGSFTGANIGEPLAIVLDGVVLSVPTIQAQLTTGGIISGNFTEVEAQQLALQLRSGALPIPLTVESVNTFRTMEPDTQVASASNSVSGTPMQNPETNYLYVYYSDHESPDPESVVFNEDYAAIYISPSGTWSQSDTRISDFGWKASPRFSPNGEQIAYLHTTGIDVDNNNWGTTKLLITDRNGTNTFTVNGNYNAGVNSDISWSPDGREIAIATGSPKRTISIVEVDTGLVREIFSEYGAYLSWSPDGNKIAFSTRDYDNVNDEDSWFINILDVDGSNLTQISDSNDLRGEFGPLRWTPDGNYLTYISFTLVPQGEPGSYERGNYEFWKFDIRSGQSEKLDQNTVVIEQSYFPWYREIRPDSDSDGYTTYSLTDAQQASENIILESTLEAMPDGCSLHILEEGESPQLLAEMYGVTAENILLVNGLTAEDVPFLQVDDPLLIPLEGCPLLDAETSIDNSSDGLIAFVSNRDGNSEIYVMNSDGSNQQRLTNNNVDDLTPTWSSDGTQIAFVSGSDENREIYVMNVDGTNLRRLTYNDTHTSYLSWSPDGSQIVFGTNEIYVISPDGENLQQLTSNGGGEPVWSPDGTRIAFTSSRDSNYSEIYVMNADGSDQRRLTETSKGVGRPVWSPDSSKIAFAGYEEDGGIYVMNSDGTNQRQLTSENNDWDPVWSPDGTQIAFARGNGGHMYVMNADGSNIRLLTSVRGLNMPSMWLPDGTQVMFTSGMFGNQIPSQIFIVNSDGSNIQQLTEVGANFQPVWAPSANTTYMPTPAVTSNASAIDPVIESTLTALPDGCSLHILGEGESPQLLAEMYGARVENILLVNGLTADDVPFLQIGDPLLIPLEGCSLLDTQSTSVPTVAINQEPTVENSTVEILEILSAGDVTDEMVVIFNNGRTVDLTDWTLSDTNGNMYTFSDQLLFNQGRIELFTRVGEATVQRKFWGRNDAVWGEPGDIAILRDAEGNLQAIFEIPISASAQPAPMATVTAPPPATFNASDSQTIHTDMLPTGERKSYPFDGTAGEKVTITLKSTDFDTVLNVYDVAGNYLVSNDDFEGATNSQITDFTLPANGSIIIEVTSFADSTGGEYTLTIQSDANNTNTQTEESSVVVATEIPPHPCGDLQDAIVVNNSTARVAFGGSSSNVRSEPNTSATRIGQLEPGAEFTITGDPVCNGGYRWWPISAGIGNGWIADGNSDEHWIEPVPNLEP